MRIAHLSFSPMAVVPIRIVGDPVLHTATEPVPVGDDGSLPADLADLIDDLYDTMAAANGVGLAANQIGVSKRVFVYDCADERGRTTRRKGVVVNPVLETSEVPETMPDPDDDDEGCLSVPGESFPTGRADWARVTGLDADGTPITLEGNGLVRADAAARDRTPGRVPVPGSVGRQACPQRQARGEVARLGRAGAVVVARRGSRSVRSLMQMPAGGDAGDGPSPPARRFGAAADRRDRSSGADGPTLQVRTKRGDVVAVAVDDVVVIKALAAAPVRTADIRNLEHAAALAWPGVEQQWLDGWLLRFGRGVTRRGQFGCAA